MYIHAKLIDNYGHLCNLLFCSAISTVSTCNALAKSGICAKHGSISGIVALSFSFLAAYVTVNTGLVNSYINCQCLWVSLGRDSKSTLPLPSF